MMAELAGSAFGLRRLNLPLALAVAALIVIGEVFLFSADAASREPLFLKQTMWMIMGLVAYGVVAATDYRHWIKWSWLFYAVSILLLIIVLLVGTKIAGARRWLMLFGVVGMQPSEFAKLATILLLTERLNRSELRTADTWFWLSTLGIVALPVLLIAVEPDFGTALVFVPILIAMMFVAGCRKRILLSWIGVGLAVVVVMVTALLLPAKLGASRETQVRIIRSLGMKEYHQNRIRVFLHPEADPLKTGWNVIQSKISVGAGGLTGKGFRNGTQSTLGFLPVSTTDFIFSVIAEEAGFVGTASILGLFAALVILGGRVAAASRDKMGRILCVGILTLTFVHVFVNIAMTVGALPVIGMPLPLLSYGGSFVLTMMCALGFLQSVWIRSKSSVEEFDE